MKRYAVSSFIPDPVARYQYFHWPASGLAVREEVVRGVPEPDHLRVRSLPCQQPDSLLWGEDARWVILEIDDRDFLEVEIVGWNPFEKGEQVQFSQGVVLFNGPPQDACGFLSERGLPVPFSLKAVQVGGDWDRVSTGEAAVSIAGAHSHAESGNGGISIAGYHSHAASGDFGLACARGGQAEAGDHGLAYARHGRAIAGRAAIAVTNSDEAVTGDLGVSVTRSGDASAGDLGVAIAYNECRTARAGERGLASAAFGWSSGGTAVAGKHGMALTQAGFAARVQADEGGILAMLWEDRGNWRLAVAYVGENGIEPNVPYTLTEDGRFIRARRNEHRR